jgi:hypothetical protein
MNLTLHTEQLKISFEIPFATPTRKINGKYIGAFSGISTDRGLAYRNSRSHPASGPQPDQTIQ